MDVKDAIKLAKEYITELFSDESISDLGLEEVEYNDAQGEWHVTLGFARPWQRSRYADLVMAVPRQRTFEIITISDRTANVVSVKNRNRTDA